nr:MAG TPA: hypothetical protein [Caudoviricetes sp.]
MTVCWFCIKTSTFLIPSFMTKLLSISRSSRQPLQRCDVGEGIKIFIFLKPVIG